MTELFIPTEGPCAGHPCDNCRICQRGRCCRNDNPHYQLPKLGEWDGPIYGELGVLADDGDKVMCHACGRYFGFLGNHVWRTHDLTADEYRAIFGLKQSTGLIGPSLKLKRQQNTAHLAEYRAQGLGVPALTPEQRSANAKRRERRLQQQREDEVSQPWTNGIERAHARRAEMEADGTWVNTGWGDRDPRELSRKGRERLQELRSDEEWKAAWAQKISEARGGHVTIACVVCGTPFETLQHLDRKVCSDACLRELRRQNSAAAKVTQRSEVRDKLRKKARERVIQRDEQGRIVTWSREEQT